MLVNAAGRVINMAQVLWVEREPNDSRGLPRSTIHFANGHTLTVTVSITWFERQTDAVFAAPSNYHAIRAWPPMTKNEDQTVSYDVLPIVGFRFRGENNLLIEPITAEGVPGDHYAIILPDGKCIDGDETYKSVEEFKAQFSKTWASDEP